MVGLLRTLLLLGVASFCVTTSYAQGDGDSDGNGPIVTLDSCQRTFTQAALLAGSEAEKCNALRAFDVCLNNIDPSERQAADQALDNAQQSLSSCVLQPPEMLVEGDQMTFRVGKDGDFVFRTGHTLHSFRSLASTVDGIVAPDTGDLAVAITNLRTELLAQINALSTELNSVKEALQAADDTIDGLTDRVADLERDCAKDADVQSSFQQVGSRIGSAESDISDLQSDISRLEGTELPKYQTKADATSAMNALDNKIDQVNDALRRDLATKSSVSDLEDVTDELTDTTEKLDSRLQDMEVMEPGTTNLIKSHVDDPDSWDEGPDDVTTTLFRDGRLIKAIRTKEDNTNECYGPHYKTHMFPVDPTKTYEFSIWVKSDGTGLNNYFGYFLWDNARARIRGPWDNPYFKSTQGDVNDWRRISGYLLPSWANREDTASPLAAQQSVATSDLDHVMHPNTRWAMLRFLTCYDDGDAKHHTLWAFPSVTVVHDAAPYLLDRNPQNVYGGLDLSGSMHLRGSFYMNDDLQFTMQSSNPQRGHLNMAYMLAGTGESVSGDRFFRSGMNNLQTYNNKGGCALQLQRRTGIPSPNRYGWTVQFTSNPRSCSGISPAYGGFYDYETSSYHSVFIQRFVAKLPAGFRFQIASNSIGSNSRQYFMTDSAGTGQWEYYVIVREWGESGSLSSTGHVYVTSDTGSTDPLVWYLASYEGFYL